jgi:DNA-binding response OmpR family regulator
VLIMSEGHLPTQRLAVLIRSLGCDVGVASSARHGLTIAVATEPDVVIISMTLPPAEEVLELARAVRAKVRSPVRLVAMGDGAEPEVSSSPFSGWLQLPATTEGLRVALGLA